MNKSPFDQSYMDAAIPLAHGVRGGAFIAAYEPLSYTIEGILPSGYLYGLTARRGAGKTALMIAVSAAVMTGKAAIIGREVERGRVAYITKENPDDFRMKLAANCYLHSITRDFLDEWLLVLDGRTDAPESLIERLKVDAEENGGFQLILYDTFQAGFAGAGGDEFNDNAGVLKFILRLRPLTKIQGTPSVVVAFHPTKNAGEEDLFPYGGGSIMNEIDGNLTLWAESAGQIKFSHNRVRGPEFEPQYFRIEKLSCPDIVDIKGRQILLPAMRPISADAVAQCGQEETNSDLALLRAMIAEPDATQAEWAAIIGRAKGRVNAKLQKLKQLNYWLRVFLCQQFARVD